MRLKKRVSEWTSTYMKEGNNVIIKRGYIIRITVFHPFLHWLNTCGIFNVFLNALIFAFSFVFKCIPQPFLFTLVHCFSMFSFCLRALKYIPIVSPGDRISGDYVLFLCFFSLTLSAFRPWKHVGLGKQLLHVLRFREFFPCVPRSRRFYAQSFHLKMLPLIPWSWRRSCWWWWWWWQSFLKRWLTLRGCVVRRPTQSRTQRVLGEMRIFIRKSYPKKEKKQKNKNKRQILRRERKRWAREFWVLGKQGGIAHAFLSYTFGRSLPLSRFDV